MRKILVCAALSVIMFSCGNSEKKATRFTNDLEKVNEFSNAVGDAKIWGSPKSVVKGIAHSGMYASKLDSANIYSYGIQTVFEKIWKETPKRIKIKFWVYSLQPNTDATLVVDINNNGQSKYWKNSKLNNVTNAKEWKEVSASFDLPSNLDIKDELKIFVWNPNKQELYIDDFDISFE